MNDSGPIRINLNNVAIVLNGPKYPENIGSVVRAMKNMGLEHLLLVNPEDIDRERILMMATHAAADLIDKIIIFESLKEALAPFQYVVGTTARKGSNRQLIDSPEYLIRKLIPLSSENRIAFLFGPEDRGLMNEDIRLCHSLLNIPTADFSSLNLSQAVMILCYLIFTTGIEKKPEFVPRLATRHELDGMYDQLKDILVRICYINPENPDYWLDKIRHFCTRMEFKAREVSIIRGICRQVDWYAGKMYRDGFNNGKAENKE